MWTDNSTTQIKNFISEDLKQYNCYYGNELSLKNKNSKKITKIQNKNKVIVDEMYPIDLGRYILKDKIIQEEKSTFSSVNLPIVEGHFTGLRNLHSVSYGFKNIVPPYCFAGCRELEQVTLFDVDKISYYSFIRNDSLKKIKIITNAKTITFEKECIDNLDVVIEIDNHVELKFEKGWHSDLEKSKIKIIVAGKEVVI